MQKLLYSLLLGIGLTLCFPLTILAATDFTTDYTVTIDVKNDNTAHVTQVITITNQTNGTYAKEYDLSISSVTPENVLAYNRYGVMKTETKTENGKTLVHIFFNQKVIGQGKSFPFTIEYDAKDLVEQQGDVRKIMVPRIAITEGIKDYSINLKVPKSFGTAAIISPKPASESDTYANHIYTYTKDSFSNHGIVLLFGDKQWFEATLHYTLINPNLVRINKDILLIPVTPLQTSMLKDISPAPKKIWADDDGNWLATYTLDRGQKLDITVKQQLILSTVPQYKSTISAERKKIYTAGQLSWEVGQAKVMTVVRQLLGDRSGKSSPNTRDDALKIFQFVAATLQISPTVASDSAKERKGGAASLENGQKAQDIDFADLFVTLARSAGIPSRAVLGFVSQPDQPNGIPSPIAHQLHAWAEYYDDTNGWTPVDPLWTAQSGGIDYFTNWDLQHVALAFWGMKDGEPYPEGLTIPKGTDSQQLLTVIPQFSPSTPKLMVTSQTIAESLFGLPGTGSVKIENQSDAPAILAQVSLASSDIQLIGQTQKLIGVIPPKATVFFPFTYRAKRLFSMGRANLVVTVNGQNYPMTLPAISFVGKTKTIILIPAAAGMVIGCLIVFLYRKRRPRKP